MRLGKRPSAAADPLAAQMDRAETEEEQGGGEGDQLKPVPYNRRLLLKSLLRAIALASYAPGGCP